MSSDSDSPALTDEHEPLQTLTILYATETGNAQDIADRIAQQCRRLHLHAYIHSMDDYSPSELISEHLVIFVVSTTGSGKEPRAMTPLWNMLLRSDLPEDLFEDFAFAVFGLGDTAYEKFCWPAKLLSRRLASLGAIELCVRGEADDQHPLGIDGAFEPWVKQLSESLVRLYPLPPGVEILPDTTLPPPRVSITNTGKAPPYMFIQDSDCHIATVLCNRRITAEDWYQDVRHFEFEFDDDIRYDPGDIAIVHPEAVPAHVEAFLASIGYANIADEAICIEHTLTDQSIPDHLPRNSTLRELFTRHLDISAVPRRSFFALLRHFVTDELEIEKLDEFLSTEGADELYEYCQRPRRMIREVLDEFRSAHIPREYIFDLFPPLRPRQFSIASSVKCHPRQVHLCVAIVQYRTMLKVPRRGVCTDYMSRLQPGDKLPIGIRKGLFTLPPDGSTPVICVGPGTGVAPMRAIIEERTHGGCTGKEHRFTTSGAHHSCTFSLASTCFFDAGVAENTLYFGCRSASKDQHYGTEWGAFARRGVLTYRTAFSRDGPEGVPRTYVQDVMREDAKTIWQVIGTKGGWVYISGSSNKMPAGVKDAIKDAACKEGGKTEAEGLDFVAALEREGRLIEECWS